MFFRYADKIFLFVKHPLVLTGHRKPSLVVAEISTVTTRPGFLINGVVNMKQIFPVLHVTRERSECNDLSFMITTVILF